MFQGVILATRDRFAAGASGPFGGRVTSPEGYLLALWANECSRAFADKLVENSEKQWVAGAITELAQQVQGMGRLGMGASCWRGWVL